MADNPHRRALTVAPLPNNNASPTQVTRPGPPQGPAVPGSTPTPFVPEPASMQGARLQQLFEEQAFTFPDTILSYLHDETRQAEIPATHFDGLHRQPIDLLLNQLEVPSTQPPKIESQDLNAILQTSAFPTLQSPGWESLELVIEAQSNLTPPVQTELGKLLDRQDLESLLRNALKPNGQGLTPRPEIPAVKPANLQLQPGDRFQPRLPTILPPGPFQP